MKNYVAVASVVIAHIALLAVFFSTTTQYKSMDLISPAQPVSVEVMTEPPPPAPAPVVNTPSVLTASDSEEEVKQNDKPVVQSEQPKPEIAAPLKKVIPTQVVPPKKRVIRKKQVEKLIPASPSTNTVPQDKSDKPFSGAEGQGKMMQNSGASNPKNVSTVGCQVPEPAYPRSARRLRQEGETLIRMVIDAGGKVIRSEVARSSGYEALDSAALSAVAGANCQPYLENGVAVPVMTIQPVTFRLSR